MDTEMIHKLSAYLDNELPEAEREELEIALGRSATLREEFERLRSVRDWAHRFPGRQPRTNVWSQIEDHIAVNAAPRHVVRSRKDERRQRRRERLLALVPFYSREHGWSNGAKRTAIFGLAGIAIAGMGRSFYQEQRANLLEEKNRAQDEQMVRAATDATWRLTATELRGRNGHRQSFRCPRGGTPSSVWGSDVYTDDSSICTAAVHAGLISFEQGGPVVIEVRPGQSRYRGSSRNGVRSSGFGGYDGSFAFVGDSARRFDYSFNFEFSPEANAELIDWGEDARGLRTAQGSQHAFRCGPHGRAHTVWGSGPYTDDSSICTAAVHAGLITLEDGGSFRILVGGRYPRFVGSTRNGVETNRYSSWEGSFAFVTGPDNRSVEPPVEVIDWDDDASDMRGWNGFQATMACPAGGEKSTIWGSDHYTDDSSICTAAVHAGIITLEEGGVVTIEIGPGRESYQSAHRNGLVSSRYGKWSGSFRFVR